jgi:decaprenylphospho-beta-D-ribofuranose 2-oxidase
VGGIENSVQELGSYSGMFTETAQVYTPADLHQLCCVFALARTEKRRVTLRGGAHAFDAQSLGNDIVVSMAKLTRIRVLDAKAQVWVEAGATWGSIVAECKAYGLIPAGTVTSSHATAGGTLSADCLSRFSPCDGKEGSWVARFSLLTIQGDLIECTRPAATSPPADWSCRERLFMAAIGGFGYLGAIVDITYNLRRVGYSNIGVRTRVEKHDSFAGLAASLLPTTGANVDPLHADHHRWDAISAGLYPAGGDNPSWMLFKSEFTDDPKRKRLILHRRKNPLRIAGEWLMRIPLLCWLMSWCFFTFTKDGAEYVDDVEDFLFFMDANATAKRIAGRLGINLRTVQQTFFVPTDPTGNPKQAQDDFVRWLDYAQRLFRSKNVTPTMQDVLFLPEDLSFCLSSSAKTAGFAVSYAFETSRLRKLEKAQQAFAELSAGLLRDFDGRVSLVKNVYLNAATLQKMYGEGAADFFSLKQSFDPDSLLRNAFLERTFPAFVWCPGGTTTV